MGISHNDFQRARRISRAIQEYLVMTGQDGARSTDVYQYLCRKGLIEEDRDEGYHFRMFLRKLKDNNLLKLIPQCTCVHSKYDWYQWYFYRVSENRSELEDIKIPKSNVVILTMPLISEQEINELIKLAKPHIIKLPKREDTDFTHQELEIRQYYKRAYEFWTEREVEIMVRAFRKFNRIDKVAELLERQPSIVEIKLKKSMK